MLFALLKTYAQETENVSLKQLIESSISHSQKIKISQSKYKQAQFSRKRAFRSYIPKITAEASYTRLNEDIVFPQDLQDILIGTKILLGKEEKGLPFNTPIPQAVRDAAEVPPIQEKNIWNANITAQMILFSGWKIPYSIKAATHQMNAMELLSKQEESNVIVDVINHYDKLAVVTKSEAVLNNTEKYLTEQSRFVEKAYKNGLATNLDMQKIELAKQQLEAKRIELNAARELLTAKLAQTSGLDENKLRALNPKLELWQVNQTTGDVTQRKDIQALDEAIKATDYKRKIERTEYMPKVVAFGKKEFIKDELSIFDPEWAVGVKLRWNIFDGFTSSTKVQQVKLDRIILENKREEAVELLNLKMKKVNLELVKNNQLAKVAAQKVKTSERAYQLSKKQYENGLITLNDHLKMVKDLEQAQLEQIQAIYAQRMAVVDMLEATGSLNMNTLPK